MNERASSEGADEPAKARARLAETLRVSGRAGATVSEAFLNVLTPAEAAKVLGVPQGTARSRLHRARATVRQVLSERDTNQAGAST